MPIVVNDFDFDVDNGNSYTPVDSGDDTAVIYIGTGIQAFGGSTVFDASDLGGENFILDSTTNTFVEFGLRKFTNVGGWILDGNIPVGPQTFTQTGIGSFLDTTFSMFSVSGLDQASPEKDSPDAISYNSTIPGSITYSIDAGGLAVLIVSTNLNAVDFAAIEAQGWLRQGTSKSLNIITDYQVFTRIASTADASASVTPEMTGDGTGRGISKVWVYRPKAAASAGIDSEIIDTLLINSETITSLNI